jgi:hypothetical protein
MGVCKIGVVGERKLIKQGVIGLLRCGRGVLRGFCGIRGADGNNKSSQSKTPDDQIEFHPNLSVVYYVVRGNFVSWLKVVQEMQGK